MDYQAIYNHLIERSQNRSLDPPFEKHHIIPKCMGGTDKKDNIAKLTPEEHYLAHELIDGRIGNLFDQKQNPCYNLV